MKWTTRCLNHIGICPVHIGTYYEIDSAMSFLIFSIHSVLRCPINPKVITEFKYDESKGQADANLFSMFRLPESRELHFQCDVAICKGTYTMKIFM